MAEPTPDDELRQAAATLREAGGRARALCSPELAAPLATWLESWVGYDVPADGPHAEDYRSALTIARAINTGTVIGQAGPDAYSDHHIVDLREDGWTLQHPLSCRPNLFDCPINKAAERDLIDPPAELGRFTCGLGDDGRFEIGDRIEAALAQTDDQETP